MVESVRCFSPHLIYCVVSIPTGPRPLSAERMVMSLLVFIWRSRLRWWLEMFDVVFVCWKVSVILVMKVPIRSSMLRGGSGALQVDFMQRALGS